MSVFRILSVSSWLQLLPNLSFDSLVALRAWWWIWWVRWPSLVKALSTFWAALRSQWTSWWNTSLICLSILWALTVILSELQLNFSSTMWKLNKQDRKSAHRCDRNPDPEPWSWILNCDPESWILILNPDPESWIVILNPDLESWSWILNPGSWIPISLFPSFPIFPVSQNHVFKYKPSALKHWPFAFKWWFISHSSAFKSSI